MAEESAKAGTYELLVGSWAQTTSKPGQPHTFVRHRRGDMVRLDAEEAQRLLDAGAVGRPGELARRQAERLQAQADAAKARAEQASKRAAEAEKDAKSAASAGSK